MLPLLAADGGIEVTGSHNPEDYNGMKLVCKDARPISSDSGLKEIKALAEKKRLRTLSILAVAIDKPILWTVMSTIFYLLLTWRISNR